MKLLLLAALAATGYSAQCTVASGAVAAQGAAFVSAAVVSGGACTCAGGSATSATPSCANGVRCVQNAGSSPTKGFCQTNANYLLVTARVTAVTAQTCTGSTATTCGGKVTAAAAATATNCLWHTSNNAAGFLLGTIAYYNCMGGKVGTATGLSGSEATNALAWGSKAIGAAACTIGGSAVAAQGDGFVSAAAITVPCVCGATAATSALPICDVTTNVRCVQNAATSATKGFCQTAANYLSVTTRDTQTTAATCAGSTATTCGGVETAAMAATAGNCLWHATNNANGFLLGTIGWYNCMGVKVGTATGLSGGEATNALAWGTKAVANAACAIGGSAVAAQGASFVSAAALTVPCVCGAVAATSALPICAAAGRCVQNAATSATKGGCQSAANYAAVTAKVTAIAAGTVTSACTGSTANTCGSVLTLAKGVTSAGCLWHTSSNTGGSLLGTVAYYTCLAGKMRTGAASPLTAANIAAAWAWATAALPTTVAPAPVTTATGSAGMASFTLAIFASLIALL